MNKWMKVEVILKSGARFSVELKEKVANDLIARVGMEFIFRVNEENSSNFVVDMREVAACLYEELDLGDD